MTDVPAGPVPSDIPDEVLGDIAALQETLDVSDEPQTPHEVVTDAITEVKKLRWQLRHTDPAYLRREVARRLTRRARGES
jgi:hypothetical protein